MISSTANPHVKRIRSLLADRRERRRERLFVLEGVRLVADALDHGAGLELGLYAPQQLDSSVAGVELRVRLEQMSGCYAATPQTVAAAADTMHPQGVVALARWPQVEAGRGGVV